MRLQSKENHDIKQFIKIKVNIKNSKKLQSKEITFLRDYKAKKLHL